MGLAIGSHRQTVRFGSTGAYAPVHAYLTVAREAGLLPAADHYNFPEANVPRSPPVMKGHLRKKVTEGV